MPKIERRPSEAARPEPRRAPKHEEIRRQGRGHPAPEAPRPASFRGAPEPKIHAPLPHEAPRVESRLERPKPAAVEAHTTDHFDGDVTRRGAPPPEHAPERLVGAEPTHAVETHFEAAQSPRATEATVEKQWEKALVSPLVPSQEGVAASFSPERQQTIGKLWQSVQSFNEAKGSKESRGVLEKALEEHLSTAPDETERAFIQSNLDHLKLIPEGEIQKGDSLWPFMKSFGEKLSAVRTPEQKAVVEQIVQIQTQHSNDLLAQVRLLKQLGSKPELTEAQRKLANDMVRHVEAQRLEAKATMALAGAELHYPLAKTHFIAAADFMSGNIEQYVRNAQEEINAIQVKVRNEGRTTFSAEELSKLSKLESNLASAKQIEGVSPFYLSRVSEIERESQLNPSEALMKLQDLLSSTKSAKKKRNKRKKKVQSGEANEADVALIKSRIELLRAQEVVKQLEVQAEVAGQATIASSPELISELRSLQSKSEDASVKQYVSEVLEEHEKRQAVLDTLRKAGLEYLEKPGSLAIEPQLMAIAVREANRGKEAAKPSRELQAFLQEGLVKGAVEEAKSKRQRELKELSPGSIEAKRFKYEESAVNLLVRGNDKFAEKYASWETQIAHYEAYAENAEKLIQAKNKEEETVKASVQAKEADFKAQNDAIAASFKQTESERKKVLAEQAQHEVNLQFVAAETGVEALKSLANELLSTGESLRGLEGLTDAASILERASLTKTYAQKLEELEDYRTYFGRTAKDPEAQKKVGEILDSNFVKQRKAEVANLEGFREKIEEATRTQTEIDEAKEKLAVTSKELSDLQQAFGAEQHAKWANFYERQKFGMMADEISSQTYNLARQEREMREERALIQKTPEDQLTEVQRRRLKAINEQIGTFEYKPAGDKEVSFRQQWIDHNEGLNKLLEEKYKLELKGDQRTKAEEQRFKELAEQIGPLREAHAKLNQAFKANMRFMRDMDLKGVEAYPDRGYLSKLGAGLKDILRVDFTGDYQRPTSEFYVAHLLKSEGYTAAESLRLLGEKLSGEKDVSSSLQTLGSMALLSYENPAMAEALVGDTFHVVSQLSGTGGFVGTSISRLMAERTTRSLLVGNRVEGEGAPTFDRGVPPDVLGLVIALQQAPYLIGAAKGAQGANTLGAAGHLLAGEMPLLAQVLGAGGGVLQTAIEKRISQSAPRDAEKFVSAARTLYEKGSVKAAWKDFTTRSMTQEVAGHARDIFEYGWKQKLKDIVTLKHFRRWWRNSGAVEKVARFIGQAVVPAGIVAGAIAATVLTGGVAAIPIIIAAVGSLGAAAGAHLSAKYAGDAVWRETDNKMFRDRNRDVLKREISKNKVAEESLHAYVENLGQTPTPEVLEPLRNEIADELGEDLLSARKKAGGSSNLEVVKAKMQEIQAERNEKRKRALAEQVSEQLAAQSKDGTGTSLSPAESQAMIDGMEKVMFEPLKNEDGRDEFPVWNEDFREQITG